MKGTGILNYILILFSFIFETWQLIYLLIITSISSLQLLVCFHYSLVWNLSNIKLFFIFQKTFFFQIKKRLVSSVLNSPSAHRFYCSSFFFSFVVCLFVFRDSVSLCSPGCPGTHSEDQAGLELRNPPASRVLGLKVCTTTPGFLDYSC